MSNNEKMQAALEQVDVRRRGFLSKLLAGGAAVAALPAMSTAILAQDDGPGGGKGKGGGKGGGGKGKGSGGKGKGGPGGGKGGPGGSRRPDPAEMAARLMKEHDKDGDGKLSKEELTAAIQAMFERRGGGRGGPGGGKGGPGGGKGGRGPGGGGRGEGGGVRPTRPNA